MTTHEPKEPNNNQLRLMREGVAEIKEVAGVALELPGERRADSTLPEGFEYSAEKEATIRQIAREKLGIGMESDLGLEQAGLHPDGVAIVEGGQSHKMLAEISVILQGNHTGPIVLSATEHRAIKQSSEDEKVRERANTAALLGISEEQVGDTELSVALQVVESLPDFSPAIDNTEQLPEGMVLLGFIGNRKVYAYSIPREYYTNEMGETKFRQPSVAEQVQTIMEATQAPDAALVTSSTYYGSRVAKAKGSYKVAAYCPQTLALVRGQEPKAAKPDFPQILSEVAQTDRLLNS